MRLCLLFLVCHATLAFGQVSPSTVAPPHQQHGANVADQLVGAWHLVSVETVRPTGEVIYPFYGKHPEGLIVYDRAGWMSVQIVSDPRPTVPLASSRQLSLPLPRQKSWPPSTASMLITGLGL